MKKKNIILLVVICLIVVLGLIAFIKKDEFSPVGCLVSGGLWKKMPDSCGDNCVSNKQEGCLTVVSFGCDCGADKCWNGQECETGQ